MGYLSFKADNEFEILALCCRRILCCASAPMPDVEAIVRRASGNASSHVPTKRQKRQIQLPSQLNLEAQSFMVEQFTQRLPSSSTVKPAIPIDILPDLREGDSSQLKQMKHSRESFGFRFIALANANRSTDLKFRIFCSISELQLSETNLPLYLRPEERSFTAKQKMINNPLTIDQVN